MGRGRSLPTVDPDPAPPLEPGCPPDRETCTRCGCRWWAASSVKVGGALLLGPLTVPAKRTRHGRVGVRELEQAAEWVADRAEQGSACMWTVVEGDGVDGLTLEQVGELIGLTREATRRIEVAALAKVGAELRRLGWTLP